MKKISDILRLKKSINKKALDEKSIFYFFNKVVEREYGNKGLVNLCPNFLKSKKGLTISSCINQDRISYQEQKDREYDRLACLVRDNLDMEKIYHILGIEKDK